MSLQDQILKDLTACVKKRDLPRVRALRFLQSGIKNKAIALRPEPLKEEHILSVLRKQIKQIKESLEHYRKAGYRDQASAEEFQLSVLESYLPETLTDEELQTIVNTVIKELEAKSIKDMGAVMKAVFARTKGALDNQKLAQIARKELSNP